MSKIIGHDDKATAWAIPKIQDTNKKDDDHSNELTNKERLAVEEQLGKIKQQAYREGFDKGQKEGFATGQEKVSQAVLSLKAVMDGMADPLKHVGDQVESELVSLAVSIENRSGSGCGRCKGILVSHPCFFTECACVS